MESQDWMDASFEEARFTLKKWREERARRSEEVVEIWEHVLSRYVSALKDELWTILEQVMLAALDAARHDLAFECLQRLGNKFPNSQRVTKLQAIRLEALGNYNDATYLYEKLLDADQTNTALRKRKIAILIAKGEHQDAISELNQYLNTFINDTEAWLQLSSLFLEDGDFSRAAFCFEEILLTNPNNMTYLCRIAEIRYSQGGTENLEIAKLYYEKSINLIPTSRALYGLILCCNQLLAKSSGSRKKELLTQGRTNCDMLLELHKQTKTNQLCSTTCNVSQNGELNPTIERQILVVELLKKCFSD